MWDFPEPADEGFADLLSKHGRPVDLKTALRQSVEKIEKRPPAPSVRRRDASRKVHKTSELDRGNEHEGWRTSRPVLRLALRVADRWEGPGRAPAVPGWPVRSARLGGGVG
jgi:hypothetical protein